MLLAAQGSQASAIVTLGQLAGWLACRETEVIQRVDGVGMITPARPPLLGYITLLRN